MVKLTPHHVIRVNLLGIVGLKNEILEASFPGPCLTLDMTKCKEVFRILDYGGTETLSLDDFPNGLPDESYYVYLPLRRVYRHRTYRLFREAFCSLVEYDDDIIYSLINRRLHELVRYVVEGSDGKIDYCPSRDSSAVRRALQCNDIGTAEYLLEHGYAINPDEDLVYNLGSMQLAKRLGRDFSRNAISIILHGGDDACARLAMLVDLHPEYVGGMSVNDVMSYEDVALMLVQKRPELRNDIALRKACAYGYDDVIAFLSQYVTMTEEHVCLLCSLRKASLVEHWCTVLGLQLSAFYHDILMDQDGDAQEVDAFLGTHPDALDSIRGMDYELFGSSLVVEHLLLRYGCFTDQAEHIAYNDFTGVLGCEGRMGSENYLGLMLRLARKYVGRIPAMQDFLDKYDGLTDRDTAEVEDAFVAMIT